MTPNQQPYPQQPMPGGRPPWQPQPQAWQNSGVQLRPTYTDYPTTPRPRAARQYPSHQQPRPYPQPYAQQSLGQQNPGFPQPPYVPYPGPFGPPLRQAPPPKRHTGLIIALCALSTILVGMVLLALTQNGGSSPTAVEDQYQNEDWEVPPVTDTPPELPYPSSDAEARTWLTDNAIYDVELASPVRCDLDLEADAGADEAALEAHLEDYIQCLTRVWGPALEEAGYVAYTPKVTVFTPGESVKTGCGNAGEGAFYCMRSQRIFIGRDIVDVLPSDTAAARTVFEVIIAHEYGHAMQARTGILISERGLAVDSSESKQLELSRRTETQADCFMGTTMNSLSESLQLTDADRAEIANISYEVGDDRLAERAGYDPDEPGDHGRGDNRQMWAERGLGTHQISVCNTYSAPASEVE